MHNHQIGSLTYLPLPQENISSLWLRYPKYHHLKSQPDTLAIWVQNCLLTNVWSPIANHQQTQNNGSYQVGLSVLVFHLQDLSLLTLKSKPCIADFLQKCPWDHCHLTPALWTFPKIDGPGGANLEGVSLGGCWLEVKQERKINPREPRSQDAGGSRAIPRIHLSTRGQTRVPTRVD